MQLAQLYQDAVRQLVQAGIDEAHVDAAQLVEFCFGVNRSQLIVQGTKVLSDAEIASFKKILDRRISREPLQYITGTREFWSLDFVVSPAVLIPRPETEFMLDFILSALKESALKPGKILDMCTGSGVIAVVLARELDAECICAVDHSREALQIAALNIERLCRQQQVSLICSDLFTAFREDVYFELIVANPPYIAESAYAALDPEVRSWEPESALFSGPGGMDIIEKIAEQAPMYLKPGGWLYLEIGSDQKEEITSLFTGQHGTFYEQVEVIDDWSQRPRVLAARKKESA